MLIGASLPQIQAQELVNIPLCYDVAYDTIEPRFDASALVRSLKLLPGRDRGMLTTEDTTPVWHHVSSVSNWRRGSTTYSLMLSNGQFEIWMELRAHQDTLRGWAEYATDAHVDRRPRAVLTAVRVACRRS